ncbi:MAG: Zn-ribbon containing protein [Methanothermobacter sp.]|nr:Zn-ribbon containing protein [Methanothermobacter sp.]
MHQCINCGAKYKSVAELSDGCPKCGGRYFKYTHKKKQENKSPSGSIETIMIHENGIYEVNLTPLLEDDSIIVSDEEGKYVIDLNFLLKKQLKKRS